MQFILEVVDAENGRNLGTPRKIMVSKGTITKRQEKNYKVRIKGIEETRVQIKLSIKTNLTPSDVMIQNHYEVLEGQSVQHVQSDETIVVDSSPVTEYGLEQNYPNPFNPVTHISYQLPEETDVRLEVYDVTGRLVQTLVHTRQSTGRYTVTFDGAKLASGVYFYRLTAGSYMKTKKLYLVK